MTTIPGQRSTWPRRSVALSATVTQCTLSASAAIAQDVPNDFYASPGTPSTAAISVPQATVGTVTRRVTDSRSTQPLALAAIEVDGTRFYFKPTVKDKMKLYELKNLVQPDPEIVKKECLFYKRLLVKAGK